ncbi:sigma-70 family RNA polymerase sigma factor [Rhizobium sp. ARZ01]|uniref:sigma-70 family RNA polymerase sigma factor n=1 Tax=Rhizobium sp. ARZ01 TaxID=2769313 RepID=UPI001786239E|nr:sigma-70 family RNA polymerase sigma factor [Rhizobium sp. ARZ01]
MRDDEIAYLIGRICLQDRQAFRRLYELTGAKLFPICLRMLGKREDAEEALQDIYVKIWQRADRFAPDETSAFAWLAAVARYHAIDVIRARRPVASDIEEAYDIGDAEPGPEARSTLISEARRIEASLKQLEAEKASAVRQAYVEAMSYEELATQFGVPLNTMKTWLRQSLLILRECLGP